MIAVNVVLKFHDHVDTSHLAAELPLDADGTGLWNQVAEKFEAQKGKLQIRRLFADVLGEQLNALIAIAREGGNEHDRARSSEPTNDAQYVPPAFENYLCASFIPHPDNEKSAWQGAVELVEQFLKFSTIEYAYIRLPDAPAAPPPAPPSPPPVVSGRTQPSLSTYLEGAGKGVNARGVRLANIDGATGKGQTLVDIEHGWFVDHPALLNAQRKSRVVLGSANYEWHAARETWDHGTRVLGLICGAKSGTHEAHGIAADVQTVEIMSTWYDDKTNAPLTAVSVIKAATNRLNAALEPFEIQRPNRKDRPTKFTLSEGIDHRNTVILIELQAALPEQDYWFPVEIYPETFEAIRLVTKANIAVIEPAGNGRLDYPPGLALGRTPNPYVDLDDLTKYIFAVQRIPSLETDKNYIRSLNPLLMPTEHEPHPAHGRRSALLPPKDSGAIMVGASMNLAPRARQPEWAPIDYSNRGSRVDCFAQGGEVATLDYTITNGGVDLYTKYFDATSAASAIIAGAALCVQGMAQANLGAPLSPMKLREALKIGTSSQFPVTDKIGVMPDLLQIAKKHF
jgi:Subtilase family